MFQFNNLQATQIDDLENALLPHLDGDGDKDPGKPFLDNHYFWKDCFGTMMFCFDTLLYLWPIV